MKYTARKSQLVPAGTVTGEGVTGLAVGAGTGDGVGDVGDGVPDEVGCCPMQLIVTSPASSLPSQVITTESPAVKSPNPLSGEVYP